ncbi:MAG: glycoside hydrolase family 31 protein [Clostridia bacterium]|nr:glycoside hydrolase family 31 protein [Clostridia bacterium]
MEKATCKRACKTEEIKVCKCAAVKDVLQSAKALQFSNAEGICFRLTFEGVNGWRLQTSKDGKFDHLGAAQALARFMNEEVKDCAQKITVNADKDTVTVTEKKGTSAVLSLGKDFSLKFCAANGKVISELTSVAYNEKGRLVMKGTLVEKEAIYGGGERLDVANKRGTAFDLYTCDGWNNSATTYVVLPVFLTTRGGGMYINRNESAWVDFGKEEADAWAYTLRYGDMDCYFYPTGSMADVLQGYTELTGHAYMPTPWMQGMHICRYGPDHWHFEGDRCTDKVEDYPDWEKLYVVADGKYIDIEQKNVGDALTAVVSGGESYVPYPAISDKAKAVVNRFFLFNEENGKYELQYVKNDAGKYFKRGPKNNPGGLSTKTIMTNFINEDMKPEAASMEGRGWAGCFRDSDESRANKEDLKKGCAWLHAHGMKAMVYIRVGGVDSQDIGFKDEYKVHADVEITNEDGTVTVNENTTAIPWILGTGDNPDVGRRSGVMRTGDYLDITSDEACEWYFDKIWGEMIDIGIDGVKIDFCECMPDGDRQIGSTKTHYKWKNPDRIVAGTEHHAYAPYFISKFYKKMVELKAAKGLKDGFMVFTRGGGIGSQRNPYMWSGDQARDYAKLDDQLLATVNSGLSGLPYMSFDMAGYAYCGNNYFTIGLENESAIFARATEFTAFLTQMQTHGDVRHAYEMTEDVKQIYRNFTRLHTELIPYMQKYSKIACDTGMPPVRHLILQYMDDVNVQDLIDEFMLGEGLLVAPILTKDTFEREVYLPAGSWTDLLTGEVIEGGKTVVAKANLGQIPVYLNNDSKDVAELLPIFEGQNWNQIKNYK